MTQIGYIAASEIRCHAVKGSEIIGGKNKSASDRDTFHQDRYFHTHIKIHPLAQLSWQMLKAGHTMHQATAGVSI